MRRRLALGTYPFLAVPLAPTSYRGESESREKTWKNLSTERRECAFFRRLAACLRVFLADGANTICVANGVTRPLGAIHPSSRGHPSVSSICQFAGPSSYLLEPSCAGVLGAIRLSIRFRGSRKTGKLVQSNDAIPPSFDGLNRFWEAAIGDTCNSIRRFYRSNDAPVGFGHLCVSGGAFGAWVFGAIRLSR